MPKEYLTPLGFRAWALGLVLAEREPHRPATSWRSGYRTGASVARAQMQTNKPYGLLPSTMGLDGKPASWSGSDHPAIRPQHLAVDPGSVRSHQEGNCRGDVLRLPKSFQRVHLRESGDHVRRFAF
jgi:hypothetical protein